MYPVINCNDFIITHLRTCNLFFFSSSQSHSVSVFCTYIAFYSVYTIRHAFCSFWNAWLLIMTTISISKRTHTKFIHRHTCSPCLLIYPSLSRHRQTRSQWSYAYFFRCNYAFLKMQSNWYKIKVKTY